MYDIKYKERQLIVNDVVHIIHFISHTHSSTPLKPLSVVAMDLMYSVSDFVRHAIHPK